MLTNCKNQSEGSAFSSVISIATLRQVRPRTRAYLALVAQKVDSAVHRINYYPMVKDRSLFIACGGGRILGGSLDFWKKKSGNQS